MKGKLKADHIAGFLDFLMSYKTHILSLPTSIKVSEFTIQRFYLFVLPLFGLLHGLDAKVAVEKT